MSSVLFSPVKLGNLQLANRIVIPPMCQYSAHNGLAAEWHMMHYGSLACSGAGMLIVEATAVLPEGRISAGDLGIWSDQTANALAVVVDGIRKYSSMPLCLQLAHAGRKASRHRPWEGAGTLAPNQGGWLPEAPSALAYDPGEAGAIVPRAIEDYAYITEAFRQAAIRADGIGFDAVELHMAHGYLLHEFLSPLSNARTDGYGGVLEKRLRGPLEVFEAVRAAFPPQKTVGVRISASDWVEGGWDVSDSCRLALELQKRACAYIHVSGGGLSPAQKISPGPGYQVAMASAVRQALREAASPPDQAMPVIAVGLITDAEQADSIIRSGQADLVAVGRAALFNPHWPWRAALELGANLEAPPQYWRSAPYVGKELFRK